MSATLDQVEGCLLGLALGDALGAPCEGGLLERTFWRVIGRTRGGEMRWTDDTQMSIDLAESLLARGSLGPDDLARRFAASYRWSRGYGPGAARVLKRIARGADWRSANRSVYPSGSFGNGAAMRAPVIGLFYASRPDGFDAAIRLSAEVTHAHPLGIEGAVVLATATRAALQGRTRPEIFEEAASAARLEPFTTRLTVARRWLESAADVDRRAVLRELGNRISAQESVVTALYVALRFWDAPYLDLIRFALALGGDVDTIAAMAGAVWGAGHGLGQLPAEPLARLEDAAGISALASKLHSRLANTA